MSDTQVNTCEIPKQEYMALVMIAETAMGILARYPFDAAPEMHPRWQQLALLLAEWRAQREPNEP